MRSRTVWPRLGAALLLAGPLAAQERVTDASKAQGTAGAASQVEQAHEVRVAISGMVLLNGFYTNAKVFNSDFPLYVERPDPPGSLPNRSLGGSARQSRIGLTAHASDVLGAEFVGEIEMSFSGGQLGDGRLAPLLRLHRTRAQLTWSNAWLVFGQEAPPIAEVNPSSLAGVDVPTFSYSGNLWLRIPQARLGVGAGSNFRIGLETAVLAPNAPPDQPQGIETEPNLAERSGRPYLQGRAFATWGDPSVNGGQLSVGGHYGWIAATFDSLATTRAFVASARFFVTPYVEIRGEAFTGEALNTIGGGGVGQDFGLAGVPVLSKGGWAQLNILPGRYWELGGGYGIDDPDDSDVDVNQARLKNASWEMHLIWRPSPLLVGFEFRRLQTTYGGVAAGTLDASHVNLAMGFEF
jgi:hypothetical protein